MKWLFSAVAAVWLSGCFSVEVAEIPPCAAAGGEYHVIAYNYGWDLFACIPIVCGNGNFDSWCPFVLFRDDVKTDLVLGKVEEVAKEKGLEIRDVRVWNDRDVFFDCYYAPVPWVIQHHESNVSAVLVRKGSK